MEQTTRENPGVLPFRLAYGIICAAVGQADAAWRFFPKAWRAAKPNSPSTTSWMTWWSATTPSSPVKTR